jgi:hypothetical protein
MGVFDLQTGDNETPAVLTIADAAQSLLLFTNLARAFRVPVQTLPEAPVHTVEPISLPAWAGRKTKSWWQPCRTWRRAAWLCFPSEAWSAACAITFSESI